MTFNFDLSPLGGVSLTDGERSNSRTDGSYQDNSIVFAVDFDGTQSDGDIIPLAIVNGNDVFVEGGYWNDAITGLTDFDIGLYTKDGVLIGTAVDLFVDGDSLATAQNLAFGDDGMSSLSAQGSRSTRIGDLVDALRTDEQYVLAATVNVA